MQEIPAEFKTVTTLSKIVALALFVLLPFMGFFQCAKYQKSVDQIMIDYLKRMSHSNQVSQPAEPMKETKFVYCPQLQADDSSIRSLDNKYFLYRYNGSYVICEQDEFIGNIMIDRMESRIQNGDLLILTTYGEKLFIADLKNKTLNYISIENFPDKEIYYDENGKPDMFLFGPHEEDLEMFSPMNDKLVFGASVCHDCSTIITNYVLDLIDLNIFKLGPANNYVEWLDNNTVQWKEIYTREKTAEELIDNPFPVKFESGGVKTLIF